MMSLRLSTAQKMVVARWLFRSIHGLRRLARRPGTELTCRRKGIRWVLDLREGVQLALYLGVYERATSRRLLQFARPGSVVVDVGANIGAHTLPLARAVGEAGRVVAVEPTDQAFARLAANCALNPSLQPRVVPVQAVLQAPGGAPAGTYYSSWPVEGDATCHPILRGQRHSASGARSTTLDELADALALARVSLVKIDVDGGELDVLTGAARVIARDRPIVVFEMCPYLLAERGRRADELVTYFDALEYELMDEATLEPIGTDVARLVAAIPVGGSRNLVARPKSRPSG